MSRAHSRLAASILALALLSGAAQAFSVSIDLPNLTFPEDDVTISTKACQTGSPAHCPTKG